jgi:threonine synthase
MSFVTRLTCVVCGEESPAPKSAGTCLTCKDDFAILDIEYDMTRLAKSLTPAALENRPRNHWRYYELLPIEPNEEAFAWPVGWTPIMDTPRLADWAGCKRLRIKDDGKNPTSSFKDRASSVGVLHAMQAKATRIACASTGNAASSLAGYAAMAGLPATIFVPQRAPEPKVAQLLIYGADVRRVRGTYAQAYDLCSAECAKNGWYNRNCAINPYLVEGKKTCGLEIAEQTAGNEPDWVAISVGDGCTVAGVAKGLMQMKQLGFISRVPRVLGVQAAGMDPVAQAFETGELPKNFTGQTIADSIDVPVPQLAQGDQVREGDEWRVCTRDRRANHRRDEIRRPPRRRLRRTCRRRVHRGRQTSRRPGRDPAHRRRPRRRDRQRAERHQDGDIDRGQPDGGGPTPLALLEKVSAARSRGFCEANRPSALWTRTTDVPQ